MSDDHEILRVVSTWTGIPVEKMIRAGDNAAWSTWNQAAHLSA